MRKATAWVDAAGEGGDAVTVTVTGLVAEAEGWALMTTKPRAVAAVVAAMTPMRRNREERGVDLLTLG